MNQKDLDNSNLNVKFVNYKPKDAEFDDYDGFRAKERNKTLKERIIDKMGNLVVFFLLRGVFISALLFYVFIIFPFSKRDMDITQINWQLYFDHIDTAIKILASYLVTIALTSLLSSKLNNDDK